MPRLRTVTASILILAAAACSRHQLLPATRMISAADASLGIPTTTEEAYLRVPSDAAAILGCAAAPSIPICEVAHPTPEEDSAFVAEAERLARHSELRCRELGAAIAANKSSVMMYRKALIRHVGVARLYGVGHTYALNDMWLVRVARRIDDLNERTLEEKTRTLRHEMSHTIGASEGTGAGWTAEDFATRCG